MPALKRYAALDDYRYLAAAAVVVCDCEANFGPLPQTHAELLENSASASISSPAVC